MIFWLHISNHEDMQLYKSDFSSQLKNEVRQPITQVNCSPHLLELDRATIKPHVKDWLGTRAHANFVYGLLQQLIAGSTILLYFYPLVIPSSYFFILDPRKPVPDKYLLLVWWMVIVFSLCAEFNFSSWCFLIPSTFNSMLSTIKRKGGYCQS